MYVLRAGSGTSTSTKNSPDVIESLKVMEELEKQNRQLRDIAEKMRDVEMKRMRDSKLQHGEDNDLLQIVQSQLVDCEKKNKQLSNEIKAIELRNANTRLLLEENKEKSSTVEDTSDSLDSLTRSTYNQITELWYYIKSRLSHLKDEQSLSKEISSQIDDVLEDIRSRKSAAIIEVELMQDLRQEIQQREMRKLGELVQRRFHYLQV